MTERSTINALDDGDLYERHGNALVAFAASLVGPSDAPDVVHDAVLSLYESGQLVDAVNPKALMYWEDMAPGAIGNLLGIADGTVKHHLVVGRERLRRTLNE